MEKISKNFLETIFSISLQVIIVIFILSLIMNTTISSVNNNREETLDELYETTLLIIENTNIEEINNQTNNSLFENYKINNNNESANSTLSCEMYILEIDNEVIKIQNEYKENSIEINSEDILLYILNQSKISNDTTVYDIYTNCQNNSSFDVIEYLKPHIKEQLIEGLKTSKEDRIKELNLKINEINTNIDESIYLQIILNTNFILTLLIVNLMLLYMTKGFKKTNISLGTNTLLTGCLFIIFNKFFVNSKLISKLSTNKLINEKMIKSITNLTLYQETMNMSYKISVFLIVIGILFLLLYFFQIITKKNK